MKMDAPSNAPQKNPTKNLSYSVQPQAPRGLQTQSGSFEVRLTWNLPADARGVDGFRVYQDTEKNMIFQTRDRNARQFIATGVKSNTNTAFYVSCIAASGRESRKVQIIGKANTDQLVTSGTGGGTNGTSTTPPPDFDREPTGGGGRGRYNQW